jgi:Na+-transporting methylmalonyl-CoA/oxaloacetate decarboxylase gamma subunit
VPLNGSDQFYPPTNEFAVLGCTEQYQICEPLTKTCTDLTGLYAVQNAVERGNIGLSKRQQATFSVVWEAAWGMVMQWTMKLLNDRVLLAQNWAFTAVATGSSTLPPNQWQQEAFNLHNLSLAMFQHRINQYAAPETFEIAPGVRADRYLDTPTDPDLLAICYRQRVLSARHYSVSVLGMAIILIVGSLLIILDQSMEALWFHFFKARSGLAKRAEWTQTGTMQLHRQTLEARGIGSWYRKNHDFPVMEIKGRTFTGLGAREELIGQTQDSEKAQYEVVAEEITLSERGPRSIQ